MLSFLIFYLIQLTHANCEMDFVYIKYYYTRMSNICCLNFKQQTWQKINWAKIIKSEATRPFTIRTYDEFKPS